MSCVVIIIKENNINLIYILKDKSKPPIFFTSKNKQFLEKKTKVRFIA